MTFDTPHMLGTRLQAVHHIETLMLENAVIIEEWFRQRWLETPPPITSSVDLRHAGFKLAPVDTNLFPAGFNNLNVDYQAFYVQAAQALCKEYLPNCTNLLLLPESHTRNHFYMQSLFALKEIFSQAGMNVRIGSLDPSCTEHTYIPIHEHQQLLIEPIKRVGSKIMLHDFMPCAILLNNDLSSGVPDILQQIDQPIYPPTDLGWGTRLKSSHFTFFNEVATSFAQAIDCDPWFFNPLFSAVDEIDFISQSGLESLAEAIDKLLMAIAEKYKTYGIQETPYVAVKADNGTYGMGVMMVREGAALLQMNRKQRTKMSASKGSRKVSRVLIQEGVLSSEAMADGAVAEPVLYMLGEYVIGGFYRVHRHRGKMENLNAPGMHFEPLSFVHPCNTPGGPLHGCDEDTPNLFYVYAVIARLAALAAAREIQAYHQERL